MVGASTSTGVYRTPAREAEPVRPPPPGWRLLLSPLKRGMFAVLVVVGPLAIFNGWVRVGLGLGSGEEARLVPPVESAEMLLALGLLLSFVAAGRVLFRSVVPAWGGLGRLPKVAYVASIGLLQGALVLAGMVAIVLTSGSFRLFEPTHTGTSIAPDGRIAYVHTGGLLSCTLDIWVAAPLSPAMRKVYTVRGHGCSGPVPEVRWLPDGKVEAVDGNGKTLQSKDDWANLFAPRGC